MAVWDIEQALRVLVIAPHPDDDAIGCGGTLARLAARGAHIDVTYVTDGSRSHRSKRVSPAGLRDIREGEARGALEALGISGEPQFLRAPDGGLGALDAFARAEVVGEVVRRIENTRADLIFAPWPEDPHPDHVATSSLVRTALADIVCRPQLLWYTVWLPVRGGEAERGRLAAADHVVVALDEPDIERKRAAIMAHRSQTTDLIDDDGDGFRIGADMLAAWLARTERFYRPAQS